MSKVISITLNENLYRLSKIGHSNYSKYIEALIKADVFKDQEQTIYDGVVKRLISDGYIHAIKDSTDDYTVVPDYQ